MALEQLAQLNNVLSRKRIEVYEVSGTPNDDGDFTIRFSETQRFDPNFDYFVSLLRMEVGSYFPNIVRGRNSKFKYTVPAQGQAIGEPKEIDFETGSYEVADIDRRIQEAVGDKIKIEVDRATGQSRIKLSTGYKVHFASEAAAGGHPETKAQELATARAGRDCRKLLGYEDDVVLDRPLNVSPHMCNVLATGKVFVELNVITGSWASFPLTQTEQVHKLKPSQVLYSFSSAVKFGHPIEIRPKYREEHLLFTKEFNDLQIRFRDENGTPVTFMKTPVLLTLEVRQV